jgi:translation initiation factor IF-1
MLEEERKRGETSKKPGENLIHMKTNSGKTVKAYVEKKMRKNEKTKYPACFGSNEES